ncbi:VCBS domain-containing protein [Rhizobium sp. 9140]|uniref:VCBS domain-containing protein n=1 Tax=Rhizobium sp. 9140 TaxID=1761900 RepID=UPI0007969609|nr:VCBS domain-containing protein [Rhizobium sp. 9140]CZT36845.1 VCBS repeat-containing protein [Rhizobium sp. 9140]
MANLTSKDTNGNGEWGAVIKDALIPLHSIVLPDGKVLAFGTDGVAGDYDARFVYSIYDPVTGVLKVLPNTTGTNIFCSQMSIDPNTGNVIIMGGDNHNTGEAGGTWTGRHDVVMFDYTTQSIRNISQEDSSFALHQARWYGTTVTLSNGEILMVGGRDENSNGSTFAEIYNSETGMRQLSGTYMGDMKDGEGTLTGTYYYPHAWQVTDGSVIIIEAGGTSNSGHDVYRMDVHGEGSMQKIGKLPFDTRNLTGSMMYETDKVIVASSTGQVWKADLSQPTIKWELAFSINNENGGGLVARTNGTFIMMPDGKVAMVGGSSSAGLLADNLGSAQHSVLFWDPATGTVTYSEKQDLARMYHSSALLLPDGTIYSGGSGSPGPEENANFQILNPSYLFDANGNPTSDRPSIVSAPTNIDTDSVIRITVDDTSDIDKITFIKSGANTHARNADVRFVELEHKIIDGNTVEITIPKANVAIPGTWMMFVVDKNGVPSVAKMVGVDMVDLQQTDNLQGGGATIYAIDNEQIDGAFALAVSARFDDLAGGKNQKIFDLGNGPDAQNIWLGQVRDTSDIEFVIKQGGETYRVVATNAIVEGETATWRVGVDPNGVMRIIKNSDVLKEGQGVVPADVDRAHYLIGESSVSGDAHFVGLIRDLKIANYGNFADLDPSAPSSPCATTGEAVCLCGLLVPDVDDTAGNDAPKVFTKYSTVAGDVTELKNGTPGENKTELTTSGIIAFADADAEAHTASITPKGADYLGQLTIGNPTTGVGVKTGSITWTYKVNDAALDKLTEGQEVVQIYDVAINDGHGGITVQTISVTLRGSDDPGFPTDSQVTVVSRLATTKADDSVVFGDNVRLLTGGDFGGGSNRLEAGNFFELKAGNLDFSNSLHSASVSTGMGARLNGGDILMGKGGIKNTVVLGDETTFSLIRADGSGAGTVNTVTIGDRSKSDAAIDMDGAGTAANFAAMKIKLGDGVSIGGGIDADGAYSTKTFDFGSGVTVGGAMTLNGAQNVNTIKAGDNFTLRGALTGSTTGVDTVTLGKNWNIDGRVNLGGGDDRLSLGLSTVDTTPTTFDGGAGKDALSLSIDASDLASFEAAAKAAGWVALGNDAWTPRGNLTWRGMTFTNFESAELKVAGRNDAPEVVASGTTKTGAVSELSDGKIGENSTILKTNGTIEFTDRNLGDTHSVTITPRDGGYLGTIDYKQPTSAQFGLLPWVYSVNSGALDWLAEGQVRTQFYDVRITDSKGASTTETVTVTITGSNDAPVITAATSTLSGAVAELADGAPQENQATHTATGAISVADADITDKQAVSYVASGANYLGTFSLGTVSGGKLGWTFQVGDAAIDRLDADEVLTQSYQVTVDDGHGGKATETVSVTIRGAHDDVSVNVAPVVDVASSTLVGTIAEPTGQAGSDPSVSGSLAFADADAAGSVPTVTATARGANYLGELLLGTASANEVGWTFSVPSHTVDFLGAGETRVQVYDVTIDDGRGGRTTQPVSVTMTGTNDAPVIHTSASVFSGGITELVDGLAGENRTSLTTPGSIAFSDADLSDSHTATFTAKAADYLGAFTLTRAENGRIGWTFSAEDSALDKLKAGEVLTQSYDIIVDDGHGGRTTRTAVVTITGASDAEAGPTIVSALQVGAGADAIVFGDNTTLNQGGSFGAGANSLTAGDNFVLKAGTLNFDASTGPASLTLGKNANLNGGDILMSEDRAANSVAVGDGSKISYVLMNGGGADASQTLTLGQKVTTDYAIVMNGSGTAADAMELAVTIGNGSLVGGALTANGNNAAKRVTLGDAVTIDGALSLQGTNNTTTVKIGDDLTLKGNFNGAGSGVETVEIGRNWQIDGQVDLGGGNDTLRIGTTTRDGAGIISGGAGTDSLDIVMTDDLRASFESAASAANWVRKADGSWDPQGRALSWQGNTYTSFEAVKTTFVAGTSAVAVKTAIDSLQATAGADAFILGSDVTLQNGTYFAGGANSLTAGDNFTLKAGTLNFDGSSGASNLTLGKNANLNGGDILMSNAGAANAVTVGDGSKISYVLMNGGGAKASQMLTLGEKVTTDYAMVIDGSGTAADVMEIDVRIGNGSSIGGVFYANGSNATKTVTLGNNVTIDGAMSLQGINNTTTVKIGDDLTLKGAFIGAGSGSEIVEIGKNWQIDGAVNLGAGNDKLRIGSTDRDSAGTIAGGAGTDSIELVLASTAEKTAFAAVAKAAGWQMLDDGSWNTLGRAVTWHGVTYTTFETAKASIEPVAVIAVAAGDGHIQGLAASAMSTGMAKAVTLDTATFYGTDGDDFILGNAGDNILESRGGNDTVDGAQGYDVLRLSGNAADYSFVKEADGSILMTSAHDGHDVLHNVEAVWFHDSAQPTAIDHLTN